MALIAIGLCVIGFYTSQRSSQVRRSRGTPLVGTWKGESGNVLNFRQDGTARFRTDGTIGYMEWTLEESEELVYYQFASRNSAGAWFARAARATVGLTPTGRYQVIEITPNLIRLRDASGEVVTLIRTQDGALEKAP